MFAVDDPSIRFPATCKTWGCEYCGPRKARQKAAIMTWAGPQRFFTLTCAPVTWQALRQRVRILRRDLVDRLGFQWEAAWTVEANPARPDLRHVHGLQHGSYVPQAVLQERWGAIVDIRAIHGRKGAANYALKEALQVTGYTMKGTGNLDDHLALNGGRGVHMTRGYLRGCTSDQVLQLLQKRQGEHEWALVRPGVELTAGGLAGPLRAVEAPPEAVSSTTAR